MSEIDPAPTGDYMKQALSPLAENILRVAAGQVVSLPWHDLNAIRLATAEAEKHGLIRSDYDDDQPTSYATPAGLAWLES